MSEKGAEVEEQIVEEESTSSSEEPQPQEEAPPEEPPKVQKPLALPSTAYDQQPDPLDVEPDLLFPFFRFYY